jgi:hypothetical protein
MDMVGSLDSFLRTAGEDIILRRTIGATNYDLTVRASVRSASLTRSRNNQLVDGTTQDDKLLVMSPTEIKANNWPGVGSVPAAPFNVDIQIPRRGDKVIIAGALYRVEVVNSIKVQNEVVRIQIMTKGGASGA